MTTNHFRALARDYRALADHYDAMADATDAANAAMVQAMAAQVQSAMTPPVAVSIIEQPPPRVYVAADPDIVAEATGEQRERIAAKWPDAVTRDELQKLKPGILAKIRAEKAAAGNGAHAPATNGNGSGRRSDPTTAAVATPPTKTPTTNGRRYRLPGDPP